MSHTKDGRPIVEFNWTSEACTRLRMLWDADATAAQIGRDLGVSRSAVVGKARRLGCAPRPSPILRNGAAPSVRPRRAPVPSERDRRAALESEPAVPIIESSLRVCQWIDEAPTRHAIFCNAPTQRGSSYCPAHHARCWIARTPRQSNPEIGLALGTTKGAVLGHRRRLGWPTRAACPGAVEKPVDPPRRISMPERPVDVILTTVLRVSPDHAAELAAEYRLPWHGRRVDLRAINHTRDFMGLPPVWAPDLSI